jgi:hypothetical protein
MGNDARIIDALWDCPGAKELRLRFRPMSLPRFCAT